jgi:hypothetical protein
LTDTQIALFAAVLAQVTLAIVLYAMLVRVRFAVANDPTTDRSRLAYDQAAWPVKARLVSNAVMSQFELPVLFYAGAAFAFILGGVDWIVVILAWIFVATRIIHAIIHTGKNIVMQRFGAFLAGFIALIVMWAYMAVHAFSAAGA